MSAEEGKVLIVGGGIAGLALAQILRGKNVPYEIFERDDTPHSRRQGWAVAIVEALPPLLEMLPTDIGDFHSTSVQYGTDYEDGGVMYNGETGEVVARLSGGRIGEAGYILRASRIKMREFLWQKLPIHTGKVFSHYEEDDTGVTAFFKDGSSYRGSILIGCDGAHSRVRSQLLGEELAKPVQSSYVPMTGEVELPYSIYKPMQEEFQAACILLKPDFRYFIGLQSLSPDEKTAKYFFTLGLSHEDPAAANAWVQAASAKSLYNRVLEITADLPAKFTDIIRCCGEQGMNTSPVRLVEWAPPEGMKSLPRGRATLVGDAAHTMVPFNGAGANTAIADAIELARLLISRKAGDNWQNLLHSYEKVALPRGREMMLASRAAGQSGSKVSEHNLKRVARIQEREAAKKAQAEMAAKASST